MARPARPSQAARSAALDARLKDLFQAVAAEPAPAGLLRHVKTLEEGGGRVNGKSPRKRRP